VIGEETSKRLDVVPSQFRVIVTHRPKYACRACTDGVVQAPAVERLIKGGLPTEVMVTYVLVAKYAWHLPFYRQARCCWLLAQGIDIKRAVLVCWVGYAAAERHPLWLRLREITLIAGKRSTRPRHRSWVVSLGASIEMGRSRRALRGLWEVFYGRRDLAPRLIYSTGRTPGR
jgi:hypothetical protein